MPELKEYKILFLSERDIDSGKQPYQALEVGCPAFHNNKEIMDKIEEADLVIFQYKSVNHIIKQRF